jgi:phage tail sheath protein FI
MARTRKSETKRGASSPGVYVEEVPSGSRPIEAVGTAVAAFVGAAKQHPVLTVAALVAVVVLVRVARA